MRISDWSSDVCSSDLGDSALLSLDEAAWQQFGGRLTEVADYLAGEGMRCAYHHHLGTVVERQEDLDRFLAVTGPNVGLTVDTGHARLGGIDPIEVIRRHPARVAHVHCKDIRPEVFGALVRRAGSFLAIGRAHV